ncbi:alpha/beta fold hydrolase [Actinoplanes sp. NPDC023714]|uniref:alpha/beta fold hydrolase n=1 Tax=Actinoplanes sp. NPDC023714 TaxID=3154322 RepID=UPI0033F9717B
MRFGVLGPVRAYDDGGDPVPLGERQRALLAALLARAGRIVPADLLIDLLWGHARPAALHSQISRLRRTIPRLRLETEPPGYVLRLDPDDWDAGRFDRLVREGRSEEALALWRGPAYAGFADTEIARLDAIRLEEARLTATERLHETLLGTGRAARSLPELEAFVAGHPFRETARDLLMRTLYALGRHAEALDGYQRYAIRLRDELGLEPSAVIRATQLRILRHEVEEVPALAGLRPHRLPDGIACATLGAGPPLIVLPGWVSSLDVMASGRDPRSSLVQRLLAHCTVTLYDRRGTGLSHGPVTDFGLEAAVAELRQVIAHVGEPVNLLAMSEAGPVATVAAAEQTQKSVNKVIYFGTYADGPNTFRRPDLNAALITMVRTHWGLGSQLFADLFRPGADDAAARHLAEVLRDSADRETAAAYLEAAYEADAAHLLPHVTAPALVLHYRGDRVIPFEGGRQLAEGLPGARMVALEGRYHLPDATDLDRIVDLITEFVAR